MTAAHAVVQSCKCISSNSFFFEKKGCNFFDLLAFRCAPFFFFSLPHFSCPLSLHVGRLSRSLVVDSSLEFRGHNSILVEPW